MDGVSYRDVVSADRKMTDMYENVLKKYAYYDNTPSGSNGLTGYDNVKNALAGVAKFEGAVVSITEEKKAKTVVLTVYFQKKPMGTVIKRDVSATDAMSFLASIKGDRNAVRVRNTNVKRSMTEESVREAYNAVLLQVALVMGGTDKMAIAERELQSYIAQQVNEEKHFSSDALTDIASYFQAEEDATEPIKKRDVDANQRMRTLQAMKITPKNARLLAAVRGAGYPEEVIKEAEVYYFMQTKVLNDAGALEDRYSLRKSEKKVVPSYMEEREDGSKVKVEMSKSGNGLYYVDPRKPEDKPASSKAQGGVTIRSTRGPVVRGEDKEYEGAVQYLLAQKYPQSVIDALTHKLVKETAKEAGYKYVAGAASEAASQ